MDNSKIEEKCKLPNSVKYFVILLSLVGFIYQSILLFLQYNGGKTVVAIKVDKIGFGQMPAITICYPISIPFKTLSELYPEFKSDYDIYKNIMNSVNDTDYDNKTLNLLLENFFVKGIELSFIEMNTTSVSEIFNNSLKFINENKISKENISEEYSLLNEENNYKIQAAVNGWHINEKNIQKLYTIEDNDPIESVVAKYGRFPSRKCFTFFSQFKQKWRNFLINIKSFYFTINYNNEWFPPNIMDSHYRYYFSMHSPNTLPQMESEDNYVELSGGHSYSISFSRIITTLLPPNFSTNCRNYSISNANEEQSRSDCIDRCILKSLMKECKNCVHYFGALIRKDMVENYTSVKFCGHYISTDGECYYGLINEIQPECESNCRPDCENQFIDFNIKLDQTISGSKWNKRAFVYIEHSRLPDQMIEHLPEMTFISFMGNFGGLAGMWLGLSLIAVYDIIISLIHKIFK